ncbi:MAG: hypothetical protein AAGA62_10515 [Bacteroidota bacterium]
MLQELTGPIGPKGLWQGLFAMNEKSHGNNTIIVGNWGLNSTLGTVSIEAPLCTYTFDADSNGREEKIMTFVRSGREMTVADLDELAASIPSIKRNRLSYTDFARSSFADLFPERAGDSSVITSFHHHRIIAGDDWEFQLDTLPRATQITPLNAVLRIPQGLLLGGNKLEVLPRVGRQDAAALQLLRDDGSVEFIDLGGENNRLEVRQLFRLDATHVLVVVAEGEHLILEWADLNQ